MKRFHPPAVRREPLSPPTRGRGLKRKSARRRSHASVSPPTRGRGLKRPGLYERARADRVAPHAGARIETTKMARGERF